VTDAREGAVALAAASGRAVIHTAGAPRPCRWRRPTAAASSERPRRRSVRARAS
jgi:hypothetical protein